MNTEPSTPPPREHPDEPSTHTHPAAPVRLSPSEIESLQRDAKATLAYATARFRERAAQAERDRLTPDEVEALRQRREADSRLSDGAFLRLGP